MPQQNTCSADIAMQDILEAMREQGSYIDISPADALTLYQMAYAHAAQRLLHNPQVHQIMSRKVVTVTPSDTALHAARLMAAAGVSGLPVVSESRVLGVLSIKDLLHLLHLPPASSAAHLVAVCLEQGANVASRQAQAATTPVSEIMSSPAIVISQDAAKSQAAKLMTLHAVNRLPVVDGQALCGIVSRADITRSCGYDLPGDAA